MRLEDVLIQGVIPSEARNLALLWGGHELKATRPQVGAKKNQSEIPRFARNDTGAAC